MYQNFILLYLYEIQHVSGDTPPIIRSLNLHWQPLVFHSGRFVGHVVGGRCQAQYVPDNIHHLHVQRTSHVWKTRGRQCSFRLLMMGGLSPETCWASYKYRIIKFWYIVASCWIFLYEFYYDALIHEHQSNKNKHIFNPLNPELNPICYLLALLGAHHFLHVSRIRVKLLTFRRLMSYVYGAPILDVSRSHTTTQHSR